MPMPRITSTGTNIPYLKYDAKSGRFFLVDRIQDDQGNWHSKQSEEKALEMIFDFTTLEVGYGAFRDERPDFHLVLYRDYTNGVPLPQRPGKYTEKDKQRYYSTMCQLAVLGKDLKVRRFTQLSSIGYGAVEKLLTKVEDNPEYKAGNLPVVGCAEITPINGKNGTNYQPEFVILRWTAKPEVLKGYVPTSQAQNPYNEASADDSEESGPGDANDSSLPF